ncbi:DHA2 family efflux MFS transporter permease subunit [Streptomyces longisporoflavus]|uniref:DHA2 family efflux MFS transporter permease subunit n=1 Tax=Streptomyces longisporoflavus TaxID=28044 RepID=UPI00167E292A
MVTQRSPATAAVDRNRTTWAMIITSLAGFMASLDILIVVTALPAIRDDLGGGIEDLEWTVNSYTLTFAVLLLLGAALGDRYGRRRIFVVSIAVFTAASVAAALSTSTGALIAARTVQGAGAAMMAPLTLTLLTTAVPRERRGLAFGLWGAANGLALALGPLVGGLVVEGMSWKWIFWVNVPVGLLLIPLAHRRLRESHGPAGRLDTVGTLLVSLGLLALVLALIEGNGQGWGSALTLVEFGLGAVLLALFLLWESRARHPMLPLRIFRDRAFSLVNSASLLMFVGLYGSLFLLTQLLQMVMGYSPLEAGLRTLPLSAMPIAVAPLAGALSDRIGSRPVVAIGMALQTTGLTWLAAAIEPDTAYPVLVTPLVLIGVGMALFFSPVANLVMSRAAPAEEGIASGVNNALRQLGGVLGVALMGAVFAAQGGYGSPREFTDGLVPALWIGAGVLAVACALTLAVPRRLAPVTAPAAAPPDEAGLRVVRRLFEEVLDGQDLSVIEEIYRPDAVDHAPFPGAPPGLEGVRHSITEVLGAYSDTAYRIEAIESRGETVHVKVHFQGRPTRRLLGQPGAKGAVHTVQGLTFRLSGGLIAERWAERPVPCPDPLNCRNTATDLPLQPAAHGKD